MLKVLRRIKFLDVLVLVVFISLSVFAIFYNRSIFSNDRQLYIVYEDKKTRLPFSNSSYNFSESFVNFDGEIIESDYPNISMIVKDGVVSVTNSSCKDQICVKMNSAKDCGDQIICLPNKFIVTIECI